jgi:hypothetical protein
MRKLCNFGQPEQNLSGRQVENRADKGLRQLAVIILPINHKILYIQFIQLWDRENPGAYNP